MPVLQNQTSVGRITMYACEMQDQIAVHCSPLMSVGCLDVLPSLCRMEQQPQQHVASS